MAISIVPLQATPNQSVAVTLSGQALVITINTFEDTDSRQYFSLSLNGTTICQSVLMVNAHAIVQAAYTGLVGDFAVLDTQGDAPPTWDGWGTRWLLVFNDAA